MPKYNVLASTWWTPSGMKIGAVIIETPEGFLKCYIGNAKGWNQDIDEQVIARDGGHITEGVAKAMFPKFKDREFTT